MLAFLFLFLGLGALTLEQANPLFTYPYDATEEAPTKVAHSIGIRAYDLDGPEGRVVVWALPPRGNKPTVFYLHGNAGNLTNREGRFRRFHQSGFGVFAPAYPDSSGSEGRPSEAALISTVKFAYDSLKSDDQFAAFEGPVVVYGESLGSAVGLGLIEALEASGEKDLPTGIVLEAPFASISDMAQATVGDIGQIAPVFMDSWNSVGRAAEMSLPLLVIHGKRDRVVPISQGQAVYEAAGSAKKKIMRVPDANHVNLWASGILTQVFGHMALKDLGL
ncbi:MAG: alpha/beta hydrolase [Cognatishimia sp.]|nr:alpha/beta hydrolase [Cognatishimia sp.]